MGVGFFTSAGKDSGGAGGSMLGFGTVIFDFGASGMSVWNFLAFSAWIYSSAPKAMIKFVELSIVYWAKRSASGKTVVFSFLLFLMEIQWHFLESLAMLEIDSATTSQFSVFRNNAVVSLSPVYRSGTVENFESDGGEFSQLPTAKYSANSARLESHAVGWSILKDLEVISI